MPLSVTELVAQLKRTIEIGVGEQRVIGEIGSCKTAPSGHVYFTLKDATAQLQCVFYRYQAIACRVHLVEGLQVELSGRASVWEGRGALQFIVDSAREVGQGSLQQQFEALKEKLKAEGLFDSSRKKQLPAFPQSVGLITSPSGAVIQDMRHRLESRSPWIKAYLFPVLVQGKGAEKGIADAIRRWNEPHKHNLPAVDYLIIARGGGSLEDLWCFNEEVVARAISDSNLPIVSAVGHETDFTIADFAADLRAPTPTAAIELTTPDKSTLDKTLQQTAVRLRQHLVQVLETAKLRLKIIDHGSLGHPLHSLSKFSQMLDEQEEALHTHSIQKIKVSAQHLELLGVRLSTHTLQAKLSTAHTKLDAAQQNLLSKAHTQLSNKCTLVDSYAAHLAAASPQNALSRGFALVRLPSGHLARKASDLQAGTILDITLLHGSVSATVNKQKT